MKERRAGANALSAPAAEIKRADSRAFSRSPRPSEGPPPRRGPLDDPRRTGHSSPSPRVPRTLQPRGPPNRTSGDRQNRRQPSTSRSLPGSSLVDRSYTAFISRSLVHSLRPAPAALCLRPAFPFARFCFLLGRSFASLARRRVKSK